MTWTNATKNTAVFVLDLKHGSAATLNAMTGLLNIYTEILSHYGDVVVYANSTKNSATYTEDSKNSATYSNQSKNLVSYSNQSKNSASYTDQSKNLATWDTLETAGKGQTWTQMDTQWQLCDLTWAGLEIISWINLTENLVSYSNQSKNSASYANQDKNTASWTYQSKS